MTAVQNLFWTARKAGRLIAAIPAPTELGSPLCRRVHDARSTNNGKSQQGSCPSKSCTCLRRCARWLRACQRPASAPSRALPALALAQPGTGSPWDICAIDLASNPVRVYRHRVRIGVLHASSRRCSPRAKSRERGANTAEGRPRCVAECVGHLTAHARAHRG